MSEIATLASSKNAVTKSATSIGEASELRRPLRSQGSLRALVYVASLQTPKELEGARLELQGNCGPEGEKGFPFPVEGAIDGSRESN